MSTIIHAAIKYLSKHFCSEKDLITKLERQFAQEPQFHSQIEAIIIRLRELNFLDDNRFAESLSRRHSHKGNRFIQQILKTKGISEEIIEQALEQLEDENSRAFHEAKKKMTGFKKDTDNSMQIKLARFLSGRGFSHTTIQSVFRNLKEEKVASQ